jgi:hypothetical protein
MADRFRIVATLGLCALFACAPDPHEPHPGEARLLDRACAASNACVTTGDAQRTSGLTPDSVGFRLEAGASVDIAIPVTSYALNGDDVWHDEVLVAGTGTVTLSCGSVACGHEQVPQQFDWIATSPQVSNDTNTEPSPTPPPTTYSGSPSTVPAHHLIITATGGPVEIADVRIVTTQSYHDGCNMD